MITLGIESSCDETSCALLENSNKLLSNVTATSLAKHQAFGGVVPEIASRHTLEHIDRVYVASLKKAHKQAKDIDLIAVTYGPGLIGSLLVGVSFAKALALALDIPLIGVNHLQAHVYANFLGRRMPGKPFLGLVVSGGHTSIVRFHKGVFKELAITRDDACGEAFDKVAKILGLGYPGGPVIEKKALLGDPESIRFRCGQFKNSYDFSFSGIKTAVLYYVQKSKNVKKELANICASFQKSVVDDVVTKTIRVAQAENIDLIVVGGGVSANSFFRDELKERAARAGKKVFFPLFEHSLDNGAMIARAGYALFKQGKRSDLTLSAVPSLGFK